MKPTPLFLVCVLATMAAAAPPILPRVTPETLANLRRSNPIATLEVPVEGKVPVRQEVRSLIDESLVIHDGTRWTIVPKGAALFVPEGHQARVDAKPEGEFLVWADFLSLNHAWITVADVSFQQAAGAEPLPADRSAFWSTRDKLVIAVHQGGPISVKAAKEPASTPPEP